MGSGCVQVRNANSDPTAPLPAMSPYAGHIPLVMQSITACLAGPAMFRIANLYRKERFVSLAALAGSTLEDGRDCGAPRSALLRPKNEA